jgi:hypothetical protein
MRSSGTGRPASVAAWKDAAPSVLNGNQGSARFISGCPVFKLTLERVSDTTLEGTFLDGRAARLVRQ